MRILVAGGAGFIGSWLCESLLKDGHEVTCVDNLFTGSKKNVHHLLESPRFTFMQWDITVPFKFEADQVYNLACPASPIDYRYDGIETTKISVLGTINLAEQALRCGATYLFSSTSEVYGDPTVNMAIRPSIRRPRTTGATSIPLGLARVTTKASAAPKACCSTMSVSTS